MYLLDTNILSDSFKYRDYPQLRTWLKGQCASDLYISSISLAELAYGLHRLDEGKRKQDLLGNLSQIQERFAERVLSVDTEIAMIYGQHQAYQIARGFNDNPFDSLLISTAKKHQLTIATRNEKDFKNRGVKIINPYIKAS